MYQFGKNNLVSVKAYIGDAKTLLAFNILKEEKLTAFAGFTIHCKPGNSSGYYLYNKLQFAKPSDHVQNTEEPSYSSINAPIQKFRWLHVPGSFHQKNTVFFGDYTYTVTPRYFDKKGKLDTIDLTKSVQVTVNVGPFTKGDISLGFTRGFVQSQAFESHFGKKAILKPKDNPLLFDTNEIAGKNNDGKEYSFKDEYIWSGFTAREKIFAFLKEAKANPNYFLDVFIYDLSETDVIKELLGLAKAGRVRVALDNAALHFDKNKPKPEDQFTEEFNKVKKKNAQLIRGRFSRYQHNKVFILKDGDKPLKILGGSTNFSATGMYVNSNHVFIFDNSDIASAYSKIFDAAWEAKLASAAFKKSKVFDKVFSFTGEGLPKKMNITFSPHSEDFATKTLDDICDRVKNEKSSVFFAVMELEKSGGNIVPTLKALHKNNGVFSYGISDSTTDIVLYKPSKKTGIKVTGKSVKVSLPAPFNKEASIGLGHQIHHKFIVCGFNTPKAVLYGGSSNLALLGEQQNGDNLVEIHDEDIATVFALEALALVDHFHFRNANMNKADEDTYTLTLYESNKWALSYYKDNDLHYVDRNLFK